MPMPKEGPSFDHRDFDIMRMPQRLREAEFDKIQKDSMKIMVGTYLYNLRKMRFDGVNIYAGGPNGIGKSMALSIVLRAFHFHGQTAIFVTAYELLQSSMNDIRYDEDYSLWEMIHRADVLMIDELGSEFETKSGYDATTMDAVIRHRYHNKAITLITTNFNRRDFREAYRESMVNVVNGSYLTWETRGDDLRKSESSNVKSIFEGIK